MKHPRLRDSHKLITREPYPINEMPESLVTDIAGSIVYLQYVGRKDMTGDDFGDAFARAVNGVHLSSPVGIADVVLDKMAWSMKTVKSNAPFSMKRVRLISGRCSPDYSYGINNPHEDLDKTGRAVLNIWNERVNIAQDYYNPVRTAVLIRDAELSQFVIFEEENHRFVANNYRWEVNKNGNLIGIDKETGEHCFTWQPHGSQFTIITKVPDAALRFEVKHPPIINQKKVLDSLKFDSSWVHFVK